MLSRRTATCLLPHLARDRNYDQHIGYSYQSRPMRVKLHIMSVYDYRPGMVVISGHERTDPAPEGQGVGLAPRAVDDPAARRPCPATRTVYRASEPGESGSEDRVQDLEHEVKRTRCATGNSAIPTSSPRHPNSSVRHVAMRREQGERQDSDGRGGLVIVFCDAASPFLHAGAYWLLCSYAWCAVSSSAAIAPVPPSVPGDAPRASPASCHLSAGNRPEFARSSSTSSAYPLTATNPPQRAYRPIAWIPGFSLGLDGTAGSAIGGEVVLPGVLGLAAGAIEPLAEALGEPGFEIGDDQAASTRAMTRSSSLGGVEKWVKRRTLARVRRRPKGCGRAESRPWANGRG